MYHLRLSGAHYDMGVRRGNIMKKAGIHFPLKLDEFQLKHGTQSEKILNEYFPEVCEEVKGLSDSLGYDYHKFMSFMLCMGCCMYNLEDNAPVEIRGCSAFAWAGEGQVLYGRNNDLPPYLKEGSKSEIYRPNGGNRFNITTSSFINGEEGLNEHGLAVAMTFVMTDLKDILPGFNSVFIVRYLLEKADSAKKALELLKPLPVSSNCNILLADKTGDMLVVECTPTEKHIRERIDSGKSKYICTVNNFTSDEMYALDYSKGNNYFRDKRYSVITDNLSKFTADNIDGDIKKLLKGEYGFTCQYNDPEFETIWSSIFDLNTLKIKRSEGNPQKTKFIDDNRLRDIVK